MLSLPSVGDRNFMSTSGLWMPALAMPVCMNCSRWAKWSAPTPLYNEVWAGNLDLSVTELPEALKRKKHKASKPRENKKTTAMASPSDLKLQLSALKKVIGKANCGG